MNIKNLYKEKDSIEFENNVLHKSDAVALAKEYNLNLICRAWQDSFQVFNEGEATSNE